MIGIYMIENLVNSKKYIGQSRNISKRFGRHMTCSSNPQLKHDVSSFGIENFRLTILKECLPEELSRFEESYVLKLKPEYNEINNFNTFFATPEARNNMKESAFQRIRKNEEKFDEFVKSGEKKRFKKRKVLATEIISGKTSEFESLYQAEKILGVPRSSIHQIISGKRRQSKGYIFEYTN